MEAYLENSSNSIYVYCKHDGFKDIELERIIIHGIS